VKNRQLQREGVQARLQEQQQKEQSRRDKIEGLKTQTDIRVNKVSLNPDGSFMFDIEGIDGPSLGRSDLDNSVYNRLASNAKYQLAAQNGIDKAKYDELATLGVRQISAANAEIYSAKTPNGQYKYTEAQRNAAAIQMLRETYRGREDELLTMDENGIKKFDPWPELKEVFSNVLLVLEIEHTTGGRRVDQGAVNAALKANEKLVGDRYVVSDAEADARVNDLLKDVPKRGVAEIKKLDELLNVVSPIDNKGSAANLATERKLKGMWKERNLGNPFHGAHLF